MSVYQGVTVEDEVFVGPCAVFTNDLRPRAQNPDWKITPTLVRHGASIGANATIVCGIEIGPYAMIAAGSVVTKDVAANQLVAGNPARPLGWVDEQGNVISRDAGPPGRTSEQGVRPAASAVAGLLGRRYRGDRAVARAVAAGVRSGAGVCAAGVGTAAGVDTERRCRRSKPVQWR